jgi:hypothetical protein
MLVGLAANVVAAWPAPERGRAALNPLPLNATDPFTLPLVWGVNFTENPELCPGPSTNGRVNPLMLKPAPVAVACVIVTVVPPEFVMVAGWLWLLPTCTLPKPRLVGATAKAPGAVAVPVIAKARFVFDALDTIARLPVTLPAEVGAKVIWNVELCPDARVRGNVSPLMRTPAPVAVACEMVALLPPELVRVTFWLCVLPTRTLPKTTVVGATPSCPAVVPSPATGKEAVMGAADGELEPPATAPMINDALPFTVMLPLTDPDDFGAKVTLNVAVCFAARVTGRLSPLIVKAALLTEA